MTRDDQREALRERNRRRASHVCPRCEGTSTHELSAAEIARRDDTLDGLRYRTCGACGNTWTLRPARKRSDPELAAFDAGVRRAQRAIARERGKGGAR